MTGSAVRLLTEAGPELDEILSTVDTLYTDLDGTLLGPGGCLFSTPDGGQTLASAHALVDATAAGIDIVPVSGRNKYQLFDDCRILGLRHYVAEVGALVVHDLMEREAENLPDFPDAGTGAGTFVDRMEASGVLDALFAAFPGKLEYHFPWSRLREYSLILRGQVDADEARAVVAEATDMPLDFVDNGVIRPKKHGLTGCDSIHAYHVLPKGVSKAGGVALDREIRHIGRERTIAVGDSASDVQVAEHVAAFFLVGNALQDPVAVAAAEPFDNVYGTRAPIGLGWAEVVRRLLSARSD